MRTAAIDDYLKAIWKIETADERISTTAIARMLGVSPASATGMVKRLAHKGLVVYQPYRSIKLTEKGRKVALLVVRHHRLIELYLARVLDVPWDEVHDEAERWEHVVSEDVAERMSKALGNPGIDIHGDPIPTAEGEVTPLSGIPLSTLAPGQSCVVLRVSDHDPGLLRHLGDLDLRPGAVATLLEAAPFNGPLTIRVGDRSRTLGVEAAGFVMVQPRSKAPSEEEEGQ